MSKFVRKSSEERKLEIRTAAIDIFLKKGYSSTTMDDIVASVDLSKGSVYRYYPLKRKILKDLMIDAVDIRDELVFASNKGENISIEGLVESFSDLFFSELAGSKYAKLYVIFLYERMFDKELDLVYDELINYDRSLNKYIDFISYEKAMEIINALNIFILAKYILEKDFNAMIDKDDIKSIILKIIAKEK